MQWDVLVTGKSSAKFSCGVMNLSTPSQIFNKIESGLDTAVETAATVSMQIAAKEAKDVSGQMLLMIYVLATLDIFAGFYTARAMETADRERLRKANYDILQNSKEARVKKRHKKCILQDTLAEKNTCSRPGQPTLAQVINSQGIENRVRAKFHKH
ncbi:hypothetical protein TNCV_5096861 [Trichonephila clavipes]|nr:hypothetical protein TNCV_5096861 [Trichonephila clavipes]